MGLFSEKPTTYGVQRGDNGDYSDPDYLSVLPDATGGGGSWTKNKDDAVWFAAHTTADQWASLLYRKSGHRISYRVCTFHPDGRVS